MASLRKPTLAELTENQGPRITAAELTVTIIATVAVAMRFLSRRVQRAQYGLDDWLILAALVCHYKPTEDLAISLTSLQSHSAGGCVFLP